MRAALALSLSLSTVVTDARADNRFGVESDVIGWATGGYHGSAWFGTERVRVRLVKALFYTPTFTLPDEFESLRNDAWEFFIDVAWRPRHGRFEGVWSSIGLELYDRTIREVDTAEIERFNALDLALRAGYIWRPFKASGFYVNPWIGLNAHLSGPDTVLVGSTTYTVPSLAPLGSLKLGYGF